MIELRNVKKRFKKFTAVSDLSFKVNEGQIVSLIGQNGAGKSTTFHMLLDFFQPDEGEICWDGAPMNWRFRTHIGYMPEERGLYPKESIKGQMMYFAALHGMKRSEAETELMSWMKKLNVVGEATDKIESLSKGNAQKVQLISCLMFNPKLLILDEPFSGLDPVNAELLIEAILKAKRDGTMIVFSTHNMINVERLSDYIVMLSHGTTVLQGRIEDIYKQFGRLSLELEGFSDISILKKCTGIKKLNQIDKDSFHLQLESEDAGRVIFDKIVRTGYVPVFNQHYPSLDEIFKYEVAVRG
ncbi:ABC transporter ATP-binding protein [Levilactobacillus parabrevis]|uniref:ABC transporter ATP-binding protein n=1 Tax=Levilactobacillus parabrevis TaxID=357278 RepID=UPI0021A75C34|nr:ATP-binding cassette domain-containing protein [Levilactobacillus parabrevis]MCT4487842.1 ATP-binding cassette domain-containing protein [Levilactobacillus parabrevis]MCT4491473.1 ATP-binding cassette domain-containing protein [Levilactobacillus parabrevis]